MGSGFNPRHEFITAGGEISVPSRWLSSLCIENVLPFLNMLPELTTLARAAQIDELVDSRADHGQSILHFAAMSGSHEMFRAVLAILYADQVCPGPTDFPSFSSIACID